MAAAALERLINANLLRRWVVEAERAQAGTATPPLALPGPISKENFVAVPIAAKATNGGPIKVEVRRGNLAVSVQWPSTAMHECALWLREVLR
jgi:hypothetical protein